MTGTFFESTKVQKNALLSNQTRIEIYDSPKLVLFLQIQPDQEKKDETFFLNQHNY